MVPVLGVAVRHFDGVDGGSLTLVTRSASRFFRRMLEHDCVEIGVGAKWLGRVLEALLVSTHVTALASIDACDSFIESVAIEVVDGGLLDLRDLRIACDDTA